MIYQTDRNRSLYKFLFHSLSLSISYLVSCCSSCVPLGHITPFCVENLALVYPVPTAVPLLSSSPATSPALWLKILAEEIPLSASGSWPLRDQASHCQRGDVKKIKPAIGDCRWKQARNMGDLHKLQKHKDSLPGPPRRDVALPMP